jgi:hypothetical protein
MTYRCERCGRKVHRINVRLVDGRRVHGARSPGSSQFCLGTVREVDEPPTLDSIMRGVRLADLRGQRMYVRWPGFDFAAEAL